MVDLQKTSCLMVAGSALAALAALSGCKAQTPYFTGDGPNIVDVDPAWENGNLGTSVVLGRIADVQNPSEDEALLLDGAIVTITGSFAGCEDPLVVFGSRNTVIVDRNDGAIQVLTPPGPVSGGPVDVAIGCEDGVSVLEDAYDYALAEIGSDPDTGEPIPTDKRMEPLFEDEYASFTMFYQAAPFINWPSAVGYGFFFNQPAPRASVFYGGNPGLSYAGESAGEIATRPGNPQLPEIDYEAPEQGDRVEGGDGFYFFRQRNTSEIGEPLRDNARKAARTNPVTGEVLDQPAPITEAPTNNVGSWFGVPIEAEDGSSATRYYRLGQATGTWCADDEGREGCGAGDDGELDDTRIPIDFEFKWMVPDQPGRDFLAEYPDASPERISWLDCLDAGSTEDQCNAEVGIELPTGDYEDVFICKSFDEFEDFPWVSDGFCVILERFETLRLEQGSTFIDVPPRATGVWTLDQDSQFYDGFEEVGENVVPRGSPVWISYEGGFYQGENVPAKNPDRVIPGDVPSVGSEAYDETPYLVVPEVDGGTFTTAFNGVGNNTAGEPDAFGGFPFLLPQGQSAIDKNFNWRIPLPGGTRDSGTVDAADMATGGWDDTYFVVSMEVRDIAAPPGFGATNVWRQAGFAWAGDDYITISADSISTLPEIGDAFRPDGENQRGGDLLGLVNLEVHRTASWRLGDGFRDSDGRMVFDVNTIFLGYFYNQHSCFDGIDNDGDGLCDTGNCEDEDGNRLDPDPACIPLNEGDEQPEYETAVCQDLEDNDGDGLVDADDPDCLDSNGVYDPNDITEDPTCGDTIDNDGDGWVDWPDDPGCSAAEGGSEGGYTYLTDCNDSIDDDGDGLIDADDPGCDDGNDPDEGGENDTCNDGLDNNEDGWVDVDDFTCRPGAGGEGEVAYNGAALDAAFPALGPGVPNRAVECSDTGLTPDGIGPFDNDGDGLPNATDPECQWGYDPSGEAELPIACEDRIDNDGDGWIDAADPQCLIQPDSEEVGPGANGNCGNGEDDDGDGWIDSLDPECRTADDDEVLPFGPLACNNNEDDDGDGFEDSEDPDCPTGLDNHED